MASVPSQRSGADRIVRVIFEYAARVNQEQDIAGLIRLNADLARDIVGVERCSLWLVDENTGELWTRVAHGVEEIRIPSGQGLVAACINQNKVVLANDVLSDQRFLRNIDESTGYRTHSVLCVPLIVETRVIGALQLLNKPDGFSEEDVELAGFVALYAASAIQAERLRQEAESNRLLRHELAIAASVQQRLLPQHTDVVRGVEYTGFCRPARFVGGDFYDFLSLPGDGFGLTLGDVSGKGFPAAVLMASIHTLLRSLMLHNSSDIAGALVELNDTIYRTSTAERYSTLFCGVLNAERSQMIYVNAGHVPPYIVRHHDGRVDRPPEGGLPVGILPSADYQQHVISLDPGDLIVCLSDGILEAQNIHGQLWDESEVESILWRQRTAPVRQLTEHLVRAVDDFTGEAEQFDDMTIIVARIGHPA